MGSLLTGGLFVLGQILIGLYIGQAAPASAYAAVGTVVTVMVWLYYSGLVFFFAAELTEAWARRYGAGVVPDDGAQALGSA